MVNLCLSVSEMHIKRKVAEVSLGKAIIWISNSVVWYVLTITALWQEMPPMAQQTKAAARTLPREPSLPRQSESSCRFSAYICLHNEHKGFALHFFLKIYIFLQHPCAKPCPSKTWARSTDRGRTLHSTAVYLWLLPSWCSPQASRGLMASIRKIIVQNYVCYGWVISIFKNRNAARSGDSRAGRGRGGWTKSEALGNIKTKGTPPRGTHNFNVDIFSLCSAPILRLRALSCAVATVSVPLLIRSLLARDFFMGSHFLVAAWPWRRRGWRRWWWCRR